MRLTMVKHKIARSSLAVLDAALMIGILKKNKNADVKTLSDLIKQKLPKRNKYTSVV